MNSQVNQKLNQLNQGLKTANIRVKIEQKGCSLYARATLPPKPDSSRTQPFQQHIPLGVKATPAGLKRAEAEAKKIGAALDLKEFDWKNYSTHFASKTVPWLVSDWLAAFKKDYFERRKRTPTSEASFCSAYRAYFQRLPQTQPLTQKVLDQTLRKIEPDSYLRLRACYAYQALGRFASIDVAFIKNLKGTYCVHRPAPRNLPSDAEIVELFYKIPNLDWRWVYAIIATFGLRPHEAFNLDTQDLENGGTLLKVLQSTKTGYREVRPLHPEWVDLFELRQKRLPNVTAKCNKIFGNRTADAFRTYGIPFPPYNLRHRYAVRCMEFPGLKTSLAARWMGHSEEIHNKIYQAWIPKEVEKEMYLRVIQDPRRPQPPIVEVPEEGCN